MNSEGPSRPCAILLLGPTGAGKTPLGETLARRGLPGRRCVHFDFGAQLRRAAAGRLPKGLLSEDELRVVRDVLVRNALLENAQFEIAGKLLRHFAGEHGVAGRDLIVLNGLPRHVGQAVDVARSVDVIGVVNLRASAAVVRERIRHDTGGDRAERSDDTAAEVARKLKTYRQRTEPLLDYYRRQGVACVEIEVGPDATADDMLNVVASALCL